MDFEISGNYPIILDGETIGELTVTREGLFWSFDARCEARGEIVRLSVYGDGREGYLGIMEPFGEMLKLNRKFSRAALRDFPTRISHAGQKGELEYVGTERPQTQQEPPTVLLPEAKAETPLYCGEFPLFLSGNSVSEPSEPPERDIPPPAELYSPLLDMALLNWRPCALPCSLFSGIREKRICNYISGAFIAQADDIKLLAVPEDVAEALPDKEAIIFIDEIYFSDEKYLISVIRSGKSISEF